MILKLTKISQVERDLNVAGLSAGKKKDLRNIQFSFHRLDHYQDYDDDGHHDHHQEHYQHLHLWYIASCNFFTLLLVNLKKGKCWKFFISVTNIIRMITSPTIMIMIIIIMIMICHKFFMIITMMQM